MSQRRQARRWVGGRGEERERGREWRGESRVPLTKAILDIRDQRAGAPAERSLLVKRLGGQRRHQHLGQSTRLPQKAPLARKASTQGCCRPAFSQQSPQKCVGLQAPLFSIRIMGIVVGGAVLGKAAWAYQSLGKGCVEANGHGLSSTGRRPTLLLTCVCVI